LASPSPYFNGDVARRKVSFLHFIYLGFEIVSAYYVLMTMCPIHKNRYKQVLVCYYKAVMQVLVIKVDKNGKDTTKQ
jgi:hypothetical protein